MARPFQWRGKERKVMAVASVYFTGSEAFWEHRNSLIRGSIAALTTTSSSISCPSLAIAAKSCSWDSLQEQGLNSWFKLMEFEVENEASRGTLSAPNHLLQWSQWQLLDSLLPTGGFAHSYGLEAAMQSRLVATPEDLRSYIIQILENTGSLLLPYVYTATKCPDIETWSKLDKWLEATLTNEVSRKASTSQGSALLRVAASVFLEVPYLKKIRDTFLGSGTVSFHHAPIFGLICGLLGFDSTTSQRAYMFMTMRDVISAATRLNLIGPLGASVLQHQIAGVGEEMVKKWTDRPVEDACQTAPLVDTVQGCHGYLFSRMFCS